MNKTTFLLILLATCSLTVKASETEGIEVITVQGDRRLDQPLSNVAGSAYFGSSGQLFRCRPAT